MMALSSLSGASQLHQRQCLDNVADLYKCKFGHSADQDMVAKDGVKFLMDSDSAPFLEEATIDYVENLGGQVGFVINNPMFSSAGGCGSGCGCSSGGGGGGGGCGCGGGGCGGH